MTIAPEAAAIALPRPARLAVAAIFLLNGLSLANWIARIPDVKQQLAMSDQTLGLVLLFAAIGALVAQPTVGWLIKRVGSQRMTTVMLLAYCLSVILPGVAWSVPTLMGALFVFGACNGGLDVSMNAQAALVEQRYDRPIMSSFHGLWSLGGLVGAALGGLVAGGHAGRGGAQPPDRRRGRRYDHRDLPDPLAAGGHQRAPGRRAELCAAAPLHAAAWPDRLRGAVLRGGDCRLERGLPT